MREDSYNAAMPSLQAAGLGGRGAGWCERLQRTGLQQGWGRARSRLRGVRGPLVAMLRAGKSRFPTRWQSLVARFAARARVLFTSEAWT